jgi:diaminopimelate epimerase
MGDSAVVTVVSTLKYEALGNDFLVFLDPSELPGTDEVDAAFVVAVCDRHRGIGADGVLVARPATPDAGGNVAGGDVAGADVAGGRLVDVRVADVRLELRNADGGRAETSGNGIRCLALALVDSGVVPGPDVLVSTDAGARLVSVLERTGCGAAVVRTEMGTLEVGEAGRAPLLGAGFEARHVNVGNPHLVLIGASLEGVDIAGVGRSLEGARPGGQNVEVVAPDGNGGLDLLVWERGSGLTEACGTGSCAAAAAGRAAGLVGDRVEVHNPGGTLVVELSGPEGTPSVWLSSPARRVFRAELVPSEIDGFG